MATNAGWAGALDSTGTRHWTRRDGRRVCDPTNPTSFTGRRLIDADVKLSEVCVPCLQVVHKARRVLGEVE